ncbi:MAG: putative 4-hydroxybutyrate-CoA transferase/hydrolase [Rhizobacter sp.]|nr:putative 4-hydroxybutyrate-CoA transferase/hydrolase [Rhizobacter sp.]
MQAEDDRAGANAIDWRAIVRPNDQLVCSHMTSEPVALLESLARAGLDFPFGVTLGVPFTMAAARLPRHATLTTFGGMGTAGAMARSHTLRISLVPYGRCGAVYAEQASRCDVALVSLARAPDGRLMLGASHGFALEAARQARCVVAEVNAQAPCVAGAPWPDDMPLHTVVETSYLPAIAADSEPDDTERRLAGRVAELVPDGACLQVGIGSMPSAVLAALEDHRHLGIHSGMLTDAMHRLILSGAIDHSCKPAHSRRAVVGCVYGSQALLRFAHLNPAVELREPAHTHDPGVIAGLPDFMAINSAIEVDLTGQMNAESVRSADGSVRYVGGVGGLNDFLRAAPRAPRGRAIVALRSRTQTPGGMRQRIVARLSGPATVTAADADVVVTEHGVALLRDKTLDVRVASMLTLADPEDREMLVHEARSLGLMG